MLVLSDFHRTCVVAVIVGSRVRARQDSVDPASIHAIVSNDYSLTRQMLQVRLHALWG